MDVHHVVEQNGRAAAHRVFGFNGSGGVWRTRAIAAAGGWTWDTVTEDAAISYLAFEKGYQFIFTHEDVQLLELPKGIRAYIQQKHRWTKGFFQVFRLYYRGIASSKTIPRHVKIEAFLHLTSSVVYFTSFLSTVLFPILVVHGLDSLFLRTVSLSLTIEPLLATLFSIYTKPSGSNGHYQSFRDRTKRVLLIPPTFALRAYAMIVFEMRAILDGLFSNDATFLTTPKDRADTTMNNKETDELGIYRSPQTKDSVLPLSSSSPTPLRKSNNSVHRNWVDDICCALGILLGLERMVFVLTYDVYYDVNTVVDVFVRLVNVLQCGALFWANTSFLMEKYPLSSIRWSAGGNKSLGNGLSSLFELKNVGPSDDGLPRNRDGQNQKMSYTRVFRKTSACSSSMSHSL